MDQVPSLMRTCSRKAPGQPKDADAAMLNTVSPLPTTGSGSRAAAPRPGRRCPSLAELRRMHPEARSPGHPLMRIVGMCLPTRSKGDGGLRPESLQPTPCWRPAPLSTTMWEARCYDARGWADDCATNPIVH